MRFEHRVSIIETITYIVCTLFWYKDWKKYTGTILSKNKYHNNDYNIEKDNGIFSK